MYEEPTILGRARDCDITIPGTHLSRRHAELIILDDDTISARDLGSVNGTFVNGQAIEGETQVRSGDVIRIDVFSFQVVGPKGIAEAPTEHTSPAVNMKAQQALENIRNIRHKEAKDYTDTQWVTKKPTSVGNRTHNVPSHAQGLDKTFWITLLAGIVIVAGLGAYFFL